MTGSVQETALGRRLAERIASLGPISIADYMAACLGDPDHGYYMTAEPFGASGDFITAPEISQLFGELIGGFLVHAWRLAGRPSPFHLVELGPGRGTLMADALRVARLDPQFIRAARLHLVETSRRLRDIQAATLANAPLEPAFADHLDSVPEDAPLFLVANEFFDALPIRQYVLAGGEWRERMIGLDDDGRFAFGLGPTGLAAADVPETAKGAPEGSILETQPAANAIAEAIGARITASGGVGLVIDYGYETGGPGDTLQALYRHKPLSVLEKAGEADLTAHVNFDTLGRSFRQGGATVHGPTTQGNFLLDLGLLERAGQLGTGKSAEVQERIRGEVERLAAPQAMGDLFKVLAISSGGFALPPFDR
ncbi:class I SAM-dependent methyltransferase [Stappia sp. F7233]|uniref:Class I SAM-dependent methyltransferase n=1 Tax=Stappia albiluteola TaxID=2758565 RepID=A0A839A9M8_9HYPH|nr:class I SAM-dependent methyltransferase [Stappia albiluteola]MBA5775758.1 class I SAM-dependent methyltransferase [Stappia albiluteola]